MLNRRNKMGTVYFGDNSDPYSGNGKIWEIAKRHNDESKRLNEGNETVARRRKVKQVERVGIL